MGWEHGHGSEEYDSSFFGRTHKHGEEWQDITDSRLASEKIQQDNRLTGSPKLKSNSPTKAVGKTKSAAGTPANAGSSTKTESVFMKRFRFWRTPLFITAFYMYFLIQEMSPAWDWEYFIYGILGLLIFILPLFMVIRAIFKFFWFFVKEVFKGTFG